MTRARAGATGVCARQVPALFCEGERCEHHIVPGSVGRDPGMRMLLALCSVCACIEADFPDCVNVLKNIRKPESFTIYFKNGKPAMDHEVVSEVQYTVAYGCVCLCVYVFVFRVCVCVCVCVCIS